MPTDLLDLLREEAMRDLWAVCWQGLAGWGPCHPDDGCPHGVPGRVSSQAPKGTTCGALPLRRCERFWWGLIYGPPEARLMPCTQQPQAIPCTDESSGGGPRAVLLAFCGPHWPVPDCRWPGRGQRGGATGSCQPLPTCSQRCTHQGRRRAATAKIPDCRHRHTTAAPTAPLQALCSCWGG